MKQFFLFFLVQFFLYGLLVLNYRSAANIWPVPLVATDILVAMINFKVIARIAKASDHGPSFWEYVLGGAVGSLTSMYGSLWWFGK